MKRYRLLPLLVAIAASAVSFGQLNVGDAAPELKVTDWVKGSPVMLGKGKPVVVEFWATWCGPCKVSIPHLSDIARKFAGKIDVIGVSISESAPEDYKTKVPAFVKSMGDKMDYTVATEGPNKHMSTKWMDAAGERGIPAAFLIDGDGKIAWIGHPMDGLDKTIEELLNGKLDVNAVRESRAKSIAEQAEMQKERMKVIQKIQPIVELYNKKQYSAAVKAMDKAEAADASLKPHLAGLRFLAIVEGNLPALSSKLDAMVADKSMTDPMAINQIVWPVVEKKRSLSPKVYASALKLATKMIKLAPNDPMMMDTYALTLWRAGKKKDALAAQKKAVDLASKNSDMPAELISELKARLKEFGG